MARQNFKVQSNFFFMLRQMLYIRNHKNGELTFGQKIYNKIFNYTRVFIEHANSSVKRLKMVKDTVRIHTTI
jgi:hypothetical protein